MIMKVMRALEREEGRRAAEPAYYYHTDHLGSTTLLTDSTGNIVQAISYLPYGEDWTEYNEMQRPDSLSLGQYRFNGKERDPESGFLYYGQRYYGISHIPMWLSVDPMLDKYPGISPYHYCHWNPVNFLFYLPGAPLNCRFVEIRKYNPKPFLTGIFAPKDAGQENVSRPQLGNCAVSFSRY